MSDFTQPDSVAGRNLKRQRSDVSPAKPAQVSTPSRKRAQKRARFSDTALLKGSTGLTPHIGKTSLKTPRRRASTPAVTRYTDHDEIQFTPLRECLSMRAKRQIRRNGMSDEMNQYDADKKSNAKLRQTLEIKNEQIQKLQAQLAEARRENNLIDNSALLQKQVDEKQAEIDLLRQSFTLDNPEPVPRIHTPAGTGSPQHSEAGDLFQIYEDDGAVSDNLLIDKEDDLAMGLELESARRAKHDFFRSSQGSFKDGVHFEDSPARPSTVHKGMPPTPEVSSRDLSKALNATIDRAEQAEAAMQAMELEIKSLGFPCGETEDDASECISNIKLQFWEMRIEFERAAPGETVEAFENAKLMPQMVARLQLVSQRARDREAELRSMRDQQHCLKGNFEHAITAAEKANNRVKELEEAIDHNAEEMLEQRMRAQAMEREAKEHEANNQSLIAAIGKYRDEVNRLEQLVTAIEAEQASRLQEVRAATRGEYSQQLCDMVAKVDAETRGRRAAEESAIDRLRKINELEAAASAARQQADDYKEELMALEHQLVSATRAHEEEVGSLNSRISGLSTSLAAAHGEIDKLKETNAKLEDRYLTEMVHGERVAGLMYDEMIRCVTKGHEERKSYIRSKKVRHANWELESDDLASDDITPMTPASIVRFSDVGVDVAADHVPGSVEVSRGKKHRRGDSAVGLGIIKRGRRRYDSGIGMDSLGEEYEDDISHDIMTPDLSSEADVDVDNDADVMY